MEIKHFMGDRAIYKIRVDVKLPVNHILDDFWKNNEKLKTSFGTKGLYNTAVRSFRER